MVDRSIDDPGSFVLTDMLRRVRPARGGEGSRRDALRPDLDRRGVRRDPEASASPRESPLVPRNPYAASKAGGDRLAYAYSATYGLPVVITRCSNNYGPYQYPEKLIPLFVTNALEDSRCRSTVGQNVRDWIHVDDHCAALDRVLHHGKNGEVYNIGARQEKPNLEIARLILETLGKPEDLITFVKDRPGHDRRYAIDPSKMEQELGWRPRISLAAGLEETVSWYRRNTAWVDRVRSGAYLHYYERMYSQRQRTLSDL